MEKIIKGMRRSITILAGMALLFGAFPVEPVWSLARSEETLEETESIDEKVLENIEVELLEGYWSEIMPMLSEQFAITMTPNPVFGPGLPSHRDYFVTNPTSDIVFAHVSYGGPGMLDVISHQYRVYSLDEHGGTHLVTSGTGGHIEFFNTNPRPAGGVYMVFMGGTTRLGMVQEGWMFVNIQRTKSFVEIDGVRSSTADDPVLDPEAITVGRHADYDGWGAVDSRSWEIVRVNADGTLGAVVRSSQEHGIDYLDDFDPNELGAGTFKVRKTITERPPCAFELGIVAEPFRFPDGNVQHLSEGFFRNLPISEPSTPDQEVIIPTPETPDRPRLPQAGALTTKATFLGSLFLVAGVAMISKKEQG